MASLVGRTVGKYRIVARLGRGGMAEVYKAYQPGLDRYVGIKVLHGHLVDDEDFIGRFEREAHAIGKLRHPNIVQAVDFDREGETFFMVMEYIDGPTLKDELKARKANNQPFTLKETSLIFSALCSAIDYAHSRGMVHRDIKPANVMINQEGLVVLTDFGIARIMGATQYTQTGALSGTPAYMSPEQGQGERGDERSDIYALGVMLYEMVTGIVPYDADTPFAVIMKHISEPLPMPSKINPDIPEAIERVILKAMSKEPADRYQTAGELAIALRDAAGVSPDENLQRSPLATIAPPPQVEEVEHPTGPITQEERTMSATAPNGAKTVWSGGGEATTVTGPTKSQQMLPLLIGGAIVLLILVVGGLAALLFTSSNGNGTTEATQSAAGVAAAADTAEAEEATATSQAEANATATDVAAATVQFMAPTQTAEAATAQAERLAATEVAQATRDAALVGGLLATVQAATAQAVAVAQTATAETVANFTPTPTPTATPLPTNTFTPAPLVPTNTPTPALPTDTPTPERPPIPGGKIAFPVDDGGGTYDVYIASMPDGEVINIIRGARQPNFRSDGQKLLVNGEGGSFGENIWQADGSGNIERPVSGSPLDLFPFYKDDGTTLTYSNSQLATGAQGRNTYLFVQCSLKPPNEEEDDQCRAVADFQIIVPQGNIGDVIGSHPVWTFPGDRIAYKGCNTWAGGGRCGMYIVGSWSIRKLTGENPVLLVDGSSVTPTDARQGLIAFMSRETGDWEAYVIPESGGQPTNISNSPGSQDGVGTISPDGQWLAFASNREGAWAIYAAPTSGGPVQKLFDFPKANPWGRGDHEWTNERMSWAP